MASVREILVRIVGKDVELSKSLNRASRNIDAFGKRVTKIGKTLSKNITAPLVAVGTAAVAAAHQAAKYGAAIDDAAIRTGIAREELQRLDYVAGNLDITFDGLVAGMAQFTKQVPGIEKGTSDVTKTFAALGVQVRDAKGELRPMQDVFFDTVNALRAVENVTQRNAVATRLFGKRAFELIPLLEASAGEVERLRGRADELGLVLSDDTVRSLAELDDMFDDVAKSGRAVGIDLALTILPILRDELIPFVQNKVIPTLRAWIGTLRELSPEQIRTALSIAAVVAAIPPLIAAAGMVTRVVASVVKGVAVLKSGAALAGLATLLTPGGILLAGLGLLAAAFVAIKVKGGLAAIEAAKLRAEIAALTKEQARARFTEASTQLSELTRQLVEAQEKEKELRAEHERTTRGFTGERGMGAGPIPTADSEALKKAEDATEALEARIKSLSDERDQLTAVIERHVSAEGEAAAAEAATAVEADRLAAALANVMSGSGDTASIDNARRAVEEFGAVLRASSELADAVGESFDRVAIEATALQRLVAALADAHVDLDQVVTAEGDTLRSLARDYAALAGAQTATSDQQRDLRESAIQLGAALTESLGPRDLSALTDVQNALVDYGRAMAETRTLSGLLGKSFDAEAAEAEALRSLIESLVSAKISLNAVVGPQGETLRELADRYLDLEIAIKNKEKAEEDAKEATAEGVALEESLRTVQEEHAATLERLKELYDSRAIGQETYNRAVIAADDALTEATSQAAKFRDALADTASQGLDAMVSFAMGSRKAVSAFVRQAIADLIKLALRAALIKLLFPEGVGTGFLAQVLGVPEKRAQGGPVQAGKSYVVGEEGPELITPRYSGYVIPNRMIAGGAAATAEQKALTVSSSAGIAAQATPIVIGVNVPASRNPIDIARDDAWQLALSEGIRVARDRGLPIMFDGDR